MDVCNINFNSLYLASWRCKQQLGEKQNNIYTTLTSLTEPEYCKGPLTTAHPLRHEGMKIVKEVEPDILCDPDTILRYPENEFVGPCNNRAQINESELEEGGKVRRRSC